MSATISVSLNFLFSTVISVAHLTWKVYLKLQNIPPLPFQILFSVVLGISCTALQTTLISKRILLSNVLQKTLKTSIWVSITIPSPPHKFMKVFYQKVRVCITLHSFEHFFCCRPIALRVLRVYPTLLTFDLWLNFDLSIWIMTPGPPSLRIGCKIKACQATSLQLSVSTTLDRYVGRVSITGIDRHSTAGAFITSDSHNEAW